MLQAKNIRRSVQMGFLLVSGILMLSARAVVETHLSLNQQHFIPGETLELSVVTNPRTTYTGTYYIFLVRPDGIIHTLTSIALSKPNEILPYGNADFPSDREPASFHLPPGLPEGSYTWYFMTWESEVIFRFKDPLSCTYAGGTVPVSDSAFVRLLEDNNRFAFDLYRAVRTDTDDNLFFSPYSISTALAMAYAGADGATATEMADTLHFTLPPPVLHAATGRLQALLTGGSPYVLGGFTLRTANALWVQEGLELLPGFTGLLTRTYGAPPQLADFATNPEGTRRHINNWIAENTLQRIPELFKEGDILSSNRLVLTNAVYFDAAWQLSIPPKWTQPRPFYLPGGEEIEADMMSDYFGSEYISGDGWMAMQLNYLMKEVSMLILVPDKGKLVEFEKNFNMEKLAEITNAMKRDFIRLTLPRFRFTSTLSLARILSRMGMPAAFSGQAGFGGMTQVPLALDDVIHTALVSVMEGGTGAAPADTVSGYSGLMTPALPVVIDRPFIFLIRDTATGTILFMGRVMRPGFS